MIPTIILSSMNKMLKLSEECAQLAEEYRGKEFTLKELFHRLGPRGGAFLSLLLSIPFILWIAFPGLSLILGFFIAVNGVLILFNKGAWIPPFWRKKQFSGEKLSHLLLGTQKWLQKIERFIRPRLSFLHDHVVFRLISGLILAITGLLLALPLPPGTNLTPALGIALIALGLLEDDGLFTIAGYFLFLVNLALFIALPLFGIRFLLRSL